MEGLDCTICHLSGKLSGHLLGSCKVKDNAMGINHRLVEGISRSDDFHSLSIAGHLQRLVCNGAVVLYDVPEFFVGRQGIDEIFRRFIVYIDGRSLKDFKKFIIIVGGKIAPGGAHHVINGKNALAAALVIHGCNVVKLQCYHHIMGCSSDHGQIIVPCIVQRSNNPKTAFLHLVIRFIRP